jgi:hypothetical protein
MSEARVEVTLRLVDQLTTPLRWVAIFADEVAHQVAPTGTPRQVLAWIEFVARTIDE